MPINPSKAQDVFKDIGEHVQFTVLKFKEDVDPKVLQEAIEEFADRSQAIIRSMRIRESGLSANAGIKVAFGFSNHAWDILFPNTPKPKELETFEGIDGPNYEMPGMPDLDAKYSMPASEGDMFFHIRDSAEAQVYEVQTQFMKFLREYTEVVDSTKGFRYFEGRAIIGFIDGTEAPAIEDAADYAIIGDEDPDYINGSYAFAQKWHHDMDFWNHLKTESQEKAVGREKFSDLELEDEDKYKNAHNVASKSISPEGEEQKIIRMNVPYSDPATGNTGTYFMGYARHWEITKNMLLSMVLQNDFLLTFSTLLSGQLFFIPSRDTLAKIADGEFD
ncbi:Dyp-type peroxidase [Convivina intestini]|uniref:Putative iron-dependent peroxidase n=1 Tax=Convivina intestini TaxID=1505726 RepID=A0A2U1D640_9LACO|nr:Dyp-type peroxidase [Convivina intestini]PVY83153.1 putative iron-dependent peroxidase [Convivina intestini]CAH1856280.1 Dye-decolorizing peroxidase YfeX [Convivina intestini]SDB95540.1 putative iron-dependent peroxidase [Leuconostocaceae bacterium R-53105]